MQRIFIHDISATPRQVWEKKSTPINLKLTTLRLTGNSNPLTHKDNPGKLGCNVKKNPTKNPSRLPNVSLIRSASCSLNLWSFSLAELGQINHGKKGTATFNDVAAY